MFGKCVPNSAGVCWCSPFEASVLGQDERKTTSKEEFVQGGTLKLSWKVCEGESTHGKLSSVKPDTLTLGQKTLVTTSGSVDEHVTGASATVELKAGFFSHTMTIDDACAPKTIETPLGSLTFEGIKCPLTAGAFTVPVDIALSGAIPSFMARAHLRIEIKATNGDKLLCADVNTSPVSQAPAVIV